jgi:hypothetical protein
MSNKSHIFIFLLVFFTISFDFILGGIIYDKLYFSEKSKKQDRLIHSAIGTNEEVLVFGSSRAYYHYNPDIIEKELGLSCYNIGYGGQNIYFHLALLKSALQRTKPKVVILDLLSIDYEKSSGQNDMEKLGILLPFVNKSKVFKEAVLMRGTGEHVKLLSSIYPFNSKQMHILRNNFTSIRSDNKGFVGLSRVWDKPIETKIIDTVEIDSSKVQAIYDFVEICNKNNVKIFVCVSPYFVNFKGKSQYDFLTNQLYSRYKINLFNFESNLEFKNDIKLFSDPIHLNAKGAQQYTKEIALKIKQNL